MNFAKKQSDNLEQQETSPSCVLQSPLERVLSLLRPRTAPTELRALVVEEQEDLETDDEGLISFEEERVRGCPQIWVFLVPPVSVSQALGLNEVTKWSGWAWEGWGLSALLPVPDSGPRCPGYAAKWAAPEPCLSPCSGSALLQHGHAVLRPRGLPCCQATKPFWPLPSLCPVEWSCHSWSHMPGGHSGYGNAWMDLGSHHWCGYFPLQLWSSITAWCWGHGPQHAMDGDSEGKDMACCQHCQPYSLWGRHTGL